MISIFSCESITNDKLKYEDNKFFGKEASLMVVTEVETSMMRIRLVGRRMEAEFALKVPVYFDLVSSQPDFVKEVTLLQCFTEQRSVPAGCQSMLKSRIQNTGVWCRNEVILIVERILPNERSLQRIHHPF
jgi:hypothetical protein